MSRVEYENKLRLRISRVESENKLSLRISRVESENKSSLRIRAHWSGLELSNASLRLRGGVRELRSKAPSDYFCEPELPKGTICPRHHLVARFVMDILRLQP